MASALPARGVAFKGVPLGAVSNGRLVGWGGRSVLRKSGCRGGVRREGAVAAEAWVAPSLSRAARSRFRR